MTPTSVHGESKKSHRTLPNILITLMALAGAGTIWLTYLEYWPVHVLTINKLAVSDDQARAGDTILLSMDYCKSKEYANLEADVVISFTDGNKVDLPTTHGQLAVGCAVEYTPLRIPIMAPGMYHIVATFYYQVNALRPIIIQAHTNMFTILPRVAVRDLLTEQNSRLLELLTAYKNLIAQDQLLHQQIEALLAVKEQKKQ